MPFDQFELVLSEPVWFLEDGPGNLNLADVVKERGCADSCRFLVTKIQARSDRRRVWGYSPGVTVGAGVACLHGTREPFELLRSQFRPDPLFIGGSDKLLVSGKQSFESSLPDPPPQHQVVEYEWTAGSPSLPDLGDQVRNENRDQYRNQYQEHRGVECARRLEPEWRSYPGEDRILRFSSFCV